MKLFRFLSKYSSLVKFSHTVFAMPFAVIGIFLALQHGDRNPDWVLILLVILCMVFARSAAMAFNRWADREIDKKNPRTSKREIPSGSISPRSAMIFTIISALCFIGTTWFINSICFFLSPFALLIVLGYSYTKRFTSLSHYILGLGLSLAPIGAFLALAGQFSLLPLLYSGLVFFWVAGFDIIYAIQDKDFDKNEQLHSVPARWGIKGALWISGLSHLICCAFLLAAGILGNGGLLFWMGTLIFISLIIYQHIKVSPSRLQHINQVFALINGLAGVILAIFYVADAFFYMGFL